MSDYKRLEKACGGSINPDTLEEFEKAMREYNEFMAGMREMFAPVEYECNGRRFNSAIAAKDYARGVFVSSGVVLGVEKVKAR